MDEAVDEGDHTGGGGEHVGPFGEGFVGGDENRLCEVAACDDLEEEVGVSVVVVEIPHLINREELRSGEAAQAPGQGGAGVLSGEFVEHVGGHGESGGEAAEDCVVEDVLDEHRLPDSVRSDEDDVGGVTDEGEGEEFLDEGAVDAFGPGPIEVGDGFEGADAGVGQASFEGAALAFAVFDVDDAFDPRFAEHGVVLDGETVECDGAQALSHGVGFSRWSLVHCRRLGVHRRIRRRGGRSRRGRGGARTGSAAGGRRVGQVRAAAACRLPVAAGR